ncbi:MAG TPA: glycosyltransferase family 2 protein [Rectinemataceae bacterium]|nr:glycosyltransferase family 2 protein [Rectinemataceae bacterium]
MADTKLGLVSVVVPVFNTAPYLANCLDSILSQSYGHLELMAVDDGSTDDSPSILAMYAGHDRRIRVLRQPNQGQSAARNRALDATRGDWITFVDSDDHIHERYVERLLELALDRHADLSICSAVEYDPGTRQPVPNGHTTHIRWQIDHDAGSIDPRDESTKASILNICLAPWGKLCRAELARSLRFPESLRRYEDNPYVLGIAHKAERIAYIREQLYYYRRRIDSVSRMVETGQLWAQAYSEFLEAMRLCRMVFQDDPELLRAYTDQGLAHAQWNYAKLRMRERARARRLACSIGLSTHEVRRICGRDVAGLIRRAHRLCKLLVPPVLVHVLRPPLRWMREALRQRHAMSAAADASSPVAAGIAVARAPTTGA